MNEITFWAFIDKTRLASGDDGYVQAELLQAELIQLPEEEILAFNAIFETKMDQAYNRDLWAAAFIINCGCSEDGFMDFRAWLIGQGLAVFEDALNNPETLITFVTPNMDTQIQVLSTSASDAYFAKTQVEMPYLPHEHPQLTGEEWHESALSQKYPILHNRFGDCAEWKAFLLGDDDENKSEDI